MDSVSESENAGDFGVNCAACVGGRELVDGKTNVILDTLVDVNDN